MILASRHQIEIDYNTETRLLEVRWVGPLTRKEFFRIWPQLIAFAQKHQVRYILLDATQVDTHKSLELEERVMRRYFNYPLPISSLEKIARVVTSNPEYNQKMVRLNSVLRQQNQPLNFQCFPHYYQALDWLLDLPWAMASVKKSLNS